jgi:Arc/MetJ-type ribon-helix-helix transcriptional regulator
MPEEAYMMSGAATAKTVTFKMAPDMAAETERLARIEHKGMSEYIREAVREKNERQMAERIRFLAAKFSAEAAAMDNEFDATLGDGLG